MARPTIGDFRSPEDNTPRKAPPPPEVPAAPPRPTTDEPALESEKAPVELLKDSDFLTPVDRYRKQLADLKISLKDAEAIYDGVLSKGYYEEYVRLRGSQRAVFRTRMYDDHLRLQTVLEMKKPQLAISQDELITRYNMAASLYEWEGKPLKHDTDNDFDVVMKLVTRLPGPLFTVLARELAKFDNKIMAVFDDGADANFS